MQIVFGDGDEFLSNFTGCVDVIGHELTHAVTENTTPLLYFGQSGALNEHVSDVFGIMVKQFVEKTDVEAADWLIGEGCIAPGVKGIALRSMKAPGTAYNDPRFVSIYFAFHVYFILEMSLSNSSVRFALNTGKRPAAGSLQALQVNV